MEKADSVLCMFCSDEIHASEPQTTVPNLGIVVHSRCYARENGDAWTDTRHGASA